MRMLAMALGAALLIAAPGAATDDPDSGAEMIGRPAPAWRFDRWIAAPAREPADYRGRVVLVRWWTEGCHFCETTLPALEALRVAHADEGLEVIGVFHPKPPRKVSDQHVREAAKERGFHGTLAVDTRWKALDRWWLDGHPERNWTSVSFLLDRDGIVRWVHGGGEYHPSTDPQHHRCAVQHEELVRVLERLLAEPARADAAPSSTR